MAPSYNVFCSNIFTSVAVGVRVLGFLEDREIVCLAKTCKTVLVSMLEMVNGEVCSDISLGREKIHVPFFYEEHGNSAFRVAVELIRLVNSFRYIENNVLSGCLTSKDDFLPYFLENDPFFKNSRFWGCECAWPCGLDCNVT